MLWCRSKRLTEVADTLLKYLSFTVLYFSFAVLLHNFLWRCRRRHSSVNQLVQSFDQSHPGLSKCINLEQVWITFWCGFLSTISWARWIWHSPFSCKYSLVAIQQGCSLGFEATSRLSNASPRTSWRTPRSRHLRLMPRSVSAWWVSPTSLLSRKYIAVWR